MCYGDKKNHTLAYKKEEAMGEKTHGEEGS